jgi:ATP-binding protein involved in chromosome partitioning
MDTREKVYQVLKKVQDPELKKSLVELEMVEEVIVEGSTARIKIALTTKGCPMKNKIKGDITDALQNIKEIDHVEITFGEMTPQKKKKIMARCNPLKINPAFNNAHVIAIGSGKGGVGKSTFTANLAFALQNLGYKTGIMDADVYGFSIPRLMGLEGERVRGENKHILPLEREGVKVISVGNFIDDVDKPIIWRGPLIMGVLKQFIEDVKWGNLDYLLIDLPPGTGDAPLNIMQMLPQASLLIITTPQSSASHVAGRVGFLANEVSLPILGIIENMSYFLCPQCGQEYKIFGEGATKELAAHLKVPILGQIPLITEIREKSDEGNPVTLSGGSGNEIISRIAKAVVAKVESNEE